MDDSNEKKQDTPKEREPLPPPAPILCPACRGTGGLGRYNDCPTCGGNGVL